MPNFICNIFCVDYSCLAHTNAFDFFMICCVIFTGTRASTYFVGKYKSSKIISLRQIHSNDSSFYGSLPFCFFQPFLVVFNW